MLLKPLNLSFIGKKILLEKEKMLVTFSYNFFFSLCIKRLEAILFYRCLSFCLSVCLSKTQHKNLTFLCYSKTFVGAWCFTNILFHNAFFSVMSEVFILWQSYSKTTSLKGKKCWLPVLPPFCHSASSVSKTNALVCTTMDFFFFCKLVHFG